MRLYETLMDEVFLDKLRLNVRNAYIKQEADTILPALKWWTESSKVIEKEMIWLSNKGIRRCCIPLPDQLSNYTNKGILEKYFKNQFAIGFQVEIEFVSSGIDETANLCILW